MPTISIWISASDRPLTFQADRSTADEYVQQLSNPDGVIHFALPGGNRYVPVRHITLLGVDEKTP